SCKSGSSDKRLPVDNNIVEADTTSIIKGCEIDSTKFKKSKIFEKLAEDSEKNILPASFSLLDFAPRRRSQGMQGSCVAWSSAYAARTILDAITNERNPDELVFSPSFIYNQIKVAGCDNGSYISDALDLLTNIGVCSLQSFPYTDKNCDKQPGQSQFEEAKNYKILGYNRLTKGLDAQLDLVAMKQNIAKGAPVVIAMPVGGSFDLCQGKKLWKPTPEDDAELEKYKQDWRTSKLGGHAMCLIGYDDNYEGGAVQIMNSWGDDFGDNGIIWVRYKDFARYCREAYGLFPFPRKKKEETSTTDFSASVGFLINKKNAYMNLKHEAGYTFSTTQTHKPGTRFKIEVTNSIPCYTYVIGQETDGSSYVLFPYTEQHSPYCGITGTRLFPKDYSMTLDKIGNKDIMAVLLSKEELNIQDITKKMSAATGASYEDKLKSVLGNQLVAEKNIQYKDGEVIDFTVSKTPASIVAIVLEINK
ncbi:MAG: peptidase C1, partial [Bacteroidia bacterium]|nr:peptidase C1 [Bacteroidia bacterium]